MPHQLVFVGTYTRMADYLAGTPAEGIYVLSLDLDTGELTPLNKYIEIDNPSFLAISNNGNYLYAVSEVWEESGGYVSAFAINPTTGELIYLNQQPALGTSTAHTMLDATNQYLFLANYEAGQSVAMLPIQADGHLQPASFSTEHTDSPRGTVPARQDKSHAHCLIPDPTNQYAMVCDLGLDKIFIYKMDLANGQLVLHDELEMLAGAGPRHLVFHPNGKFAFVIEELSSTITALAYDDKQGKLTSIDRISTLPADTTIHNQCADIHITPDGRFLYGSNRGHDSLAIYAIDPSSGKLTLIGHQATHGRSPRNFVIDPSGKFLIVANQDSDNIVVFRINKVTGELEETGYGIDCPMPVCLDRKSVV